MRTFAQFTRNYMKNKILKNKGASDLGLLVIVIFVLFLMWLFTGGPSRPESEQGLFMKSPIDNLQVAPSGNNLEQYNTTSDGDIE
jgi:hypothetical protein